MCDEIVVYASACALRNMMTSTMKLDYSEEEVRSVNLTHSSSPNYAQRQDTGQDVWSWVWMQWMTVTSIVPYHALHVPQHAAVPLSGPLNLVISSALSTETVFAYTVLKLAQLRWTDHVIRMPDERLPKKVFYGELQEGKHTI